VRDDGVVHHERALRGIAAANVLVDEDVAAGRELRLAALDRTRRVVGHTVGRTREQERQRRPGSFRIRRTQDDGVQLRSVAHGDHRLAANVVVRRGCRLRGGWPLGGGCDREKANDEAGYGEEFFHVYLSVAEIK
jgi:hypothetical protein